MVANISDSNTTNRSEKESEVNVMDMCYDGTLVLPSSYAVMDEEEMMPFGMSRTYIVICF